MEVKVARSSVAAQSSRPEREVVTQTFTWSSELLFQEVASDGLKAVCVLQCSTCKSSKICSIISLVFSARQQLGKSINRVKKLN